MSMASVFLSTLVKIREPYPLSNGLLIFEGSKKLLQEKKKKLKNSSLSLCFPEDDTGSLRENK